jgi:hypothetical protein
MVGISMLFSGISRFFLSHHLEAVQLNATAHLITAAHCCVLTTESIRAAGVDL